MNGKASYGTFTQSPKATLRITWQCDGISKDNSLSRCKTDLSQSLFYNSNESTLTVLSLCLSVCLLSLCLCPSIPLSVQVYTGRDERTACRSQFSFSHVGSGIRTQATGLSASPFTHGATSLALAILLNHRHQDDEQAVNVEYNLYPSQSTAAKPYRFFSFGITFEIFPFFHSKSLIISTAAMSPSLLSL